MIIHERSKSMEENRINADKGTPDEIVTNKVQVKAKNEPVVGKEESKNSNMESGLVPDGKGGAVVDK